MTTYTWQTIRTNAIKNFAGDAPSAQLETRILEHFQRTPENVIRAIDRISHDYAQGKVHSPWPALQARLDRANTTTDVRADDTSQREHRVRNAETWIRNAGLHFDRDTELLDELFGDRGTLRDYRDDATLRTRMLNLWQELRPTGEKLKRDASTRAEARLEGEADSKQRKRAAEPEPVLATTSPDDDIPF